jgi:hypothetical protein
MGNSLVLLLNMWLVLKISFKDSKNRLLITIRINVIATINDSYEQPPASFISIDKKPDM